MPKILRFESIGISVIFVEDHAFQFPEFTDFDEMLWSDISVPESGHIQRINSFGYLLEDGKCFFFFDDFAFGVCFECELILIGDKDEPFRNGVGVLDLEEMLREKLIAKIGQDSLVVFGRFEEIQLV